MQLINKTAVKKTIVHTWYIYPILAGIITVLWLWAFSAFHQPTKHQMLTLFFSARVRKTGFADKLLSYYPKEKLREVSVSGLLPTASGYPAKLKTALSDSDLLILDKTTLNDLSHREIVIYDITDDIKTKYLEGEHEYYTTTDESGTHSYGVLIETTHLSKYLDFDEAEDYYVCVAKSSLNCGTLRSKGNAKYDNALTFMNYLLEF